MKVTTVECKSRVGITVGLIDSILTTSHVLAERLKGEIKRRGDIRCVDPAIVAAMQDLGSDLDLNFILTGCSYHGLPEHEAVLQERVDLLRMDSRSPDQNARLAELHALVRDMPTKALNDPETAIDKFSADSFNFVLEILKRQTVDGSEPPVIPIALPETAEVTELRDMANDWHRQFTDLETSAQKHGYLVEYGEHGRPEFVPGPKVKEFAEAVGAFRQLATWLEADYPKRSVAIDQPEPLRSRWKVQLFGVSCEEDFWGEGDSIPGAINAVLAALHGERKC